MHTRPSLYQIGYLLGLLSSRLIDERFRVTSGTTNVGVYELEQLPIRKISFESDPTNVNTIVHELLASLNSKTQEFLGRIDYLIDKEKTNIVQNVVSKLAFQMIDLNGQVSNETNRFLSWLEKRLHMNSKEGLDSLTGKSTIFNYIGDYQRNEKNATWDEFYYRLHQNRNRFKANLTQVKAEIQQAYEKSLATLRPIKQQLAATDALIDQIVYKLYGLTDEEIELIERPAYEQALTEAKAKVLQDEKLQKDPEAALEVIAEGVLPAAKRLQSRIPQQEERTRLDQDLPGWHLLPGDVPTFLLTGEYNIATQPEYLDFSTSVIAYAKAVETALYTRLFLAFRAESGYSDTDCRNKFLQEFMRGEKHLTLGSFPIIMGSSKETALRQFAATRFTNAENRLFGESGVRGLLDDATSINLRNKAAHDEVLTRNDAQQARAWALAILHHL